MISVKIVTLDYYMSYPIRNFDPVYSEFRGTVVKQVPVIQIFGSSQKGQKTCVNIHGVLPYIYIPYDGVEPFGSFSYKIASELDKSINISLGQATSNTCHIHNIIQISAMSIYGYNDHEQQFLKIYFYNPIMIKKACALLENGAVLGKTFQPYESHINYILQFMIDYNLFGMSFVNLSDIVYRKNPEDKHKDIPSHLILPSSIKKTSVCSLEIDALSTSILNRKEIKSSELAVNPGLASIWEDEKQRRRNKEIDSQISVCLTQDRPEVSPTSTHNFFKNKLAEKLSQTHDDSSVESTQETKEHQSTELNESDAVFFDLLEDLKQNANVEEDSILSQKVQEDYDTDEEVLSNFFQNSLNINNEWENSFFENCSFTQLDKELKSPSQMSLEKNEHDKNLKNYLINQLDGTFNSSYKHFTHFDNYDKNIKDVFSQNDLPDTKIKILSDVSVKCDKNSLVTWDIGKSKILVSIERKCSEPKRIEKPNLSPIHCEVPTFNLDTNFNDVLFNDVFITDLPKDLSSDQSCNELSNWYNNISSFIENDEPIETVKKCEYCLTDCEYIKNIQMNDDNSLKTTCSCCVKIIEKNNGNSTAENYIELKVPVEVMDVLNKLEEENMSSNLKKKIKKKNQVFSKILNNDDPLYKMNENFLNNYKDVEIKKLNWNLDGQNDSLDSGSSSSIDDLNKIEEIKLTPFKLSNRRSKKNKSQSGFYKRLSLKKSTRKSSACLKRQSSLDSKKENLDTKIVINKSKKNLSSTDEKENSCKVNRKSNRIQQNKNKLLKANNLNTEEVKFVKKSIIHKELKILLVPCDSLISNTKKSEHSKKPKRNLKETKKPLRQSLRNKKEIITITFDENDKISQNNENISNKEVKIKNENILRENFSSDEKHESSSKNKREKPNNDLNVMQPKLTRSKIKLMNNDKILSNNILVNNNVTNQENIIQISSDSSEDIKEPTENNTLNNSPTRKLRRKKLSSPKYSPLQIIVKSPKTKLKTETNDYEPISKRIRNYYMNGDSPTKNNNFSLLKDENSQGVGELQPFPILDKEAQIQKIYVNNLQHSNNCDKNDLNTKLALSKKLPIDSIKKSLFSNKTDLNVTITEEIKCCSYVKSKLSQKTSEMNSICNKEKDLLNLAVSKEVKMCVKKKDKKFVPFNPPKCYFIDESSEKSSSIQETLSQQYEKENTDLGSFTKVNNLTVAELYDIDRDFAPQPGTSKMDCEQNDNFDMSHDITLNNSFVIGYNNDSILFSQISILNSTVTEVESSSNIWMPKYFPPTKEDIVNSLTEYKIPENRYQDPFYSNYSDVTKKIDVGHNVLKIPSKLPVDLEEFDSCTGFVGIENWRKTFNSCKNLRVALASQSEVILTPCIHPPTSKEVKSWIKQQIMEVKSVEVKEVKKPRIVIPSSPGNSNDSFNESITLSPCTPESLPSTPSQKSSLSCSSTPTSARTNKRSSLRRSLFQLKYSADNQSSDDSRQITGVTLDNTHGFQMSFENLQDAKALSENQYLTILVLELHIKTRADLNPDPQYDSIQAIFYSILNDVPDESQIKEETGVIFVESEPVLRNSNSKYKCFYVKSEIELIEVFIELIRKWDPDIFAGFEIEMLSWGYLIERCSILGIDLHISRSNPDLQQYKKKSENTESSTVLQLNGRIVLDVWRLFRHEIALQSYTFENLMYHVLHRRIPAHSFKSLTDWWESNFHRHVTINYYLIRVHGLLKLMDQLDLIGRTCELARLFGIQFFEVLSRGSQFRVESMMLRLAKPLNFIPISPSVQQRAKMRAPEWIPLIFEPESRFYVDPVIVLDFQSLYPSIIIAYNYCFSTCIGRVERLGTNLPFEFGACQLKLSRSKVKKLENKLNFSPCGVGFVKSEIRRGILPRMLEEILETRLMVKKSMKQNKDDKILQRVLHSRQLGLKLIANVTYGYTAANFSGRMPCSEVGDSVVSKGRETLERAIKTIEQTKKWRARVVYGDTDSLFVLVAGRSREDAFKIGEEIAEAVTNDNPPPVKLKLEKVYHPCILQTKKRYVGYMYESADQKEPEYNAKGIETVRRDGCPAVAKMLEKTLRILFDTRDMSLVKRYVCRQFDKLISGKASIQDLIFAKEYRGAKGYRPGACVPALELARRWTAVDRRKEPRRGQRVPYIVVHGPPGVPLIKLVKCPRDLLNSDQHSSLRPNAIYYVTRVIIPPLNRCFSLIGADVQIWFNEIPRKQIQILPTDIHFENSKKSTISQYFATMSCAVCNSQTRDGLCEECLNDPQQTMVVLQEKLRLWERSFDDVQKICKSCCSRVECTDCVSLDCPVLYRYCQTKRDLKQVPFVRSLILKFDTAT